MILNLTKPQILQQFQRQEGDTGSPEVQIALMTSRIEQIAQHLKTHKKDLHCKIGLLRHVSNRRSLLTYLKRTRPEDYATILKRLGLRR